MVDSKGKVRKKKIVDAPAKKAFTGSLLLQCEPFDYTPDKWLDKMGYPKDGRPVFTLQPLSSYDRHWIEADNNKMTYEGMLWAKKEGVDITQKDNTYLAMCKFSEFSDREKRLSIVRRSIKKVKNLDGLDFESEEGLDEMVFDRLPIELLNLIEAKLLSVAHLTDEEVLGL